MPRHYDRTDCHSKATRQIRPGIYIMLVFYPADGAPQDWATLLMIGDRDRERGTSLARVDSWHDKLHVDLDYEAPGSKRWIENEEFPRHLLLEKASKATDYLSANWQIFLENYINRDAAFQHPDLG